MSLAGSHISDPRTFESDLRGFFTARCSCGWDYGPLPDVETAVDALTEHAVESVFERPLVLVETGCEPEGLEDPVVTKEDRITLVSLSWHRTMEQTLIADALDALSKYKLGHPRIDKAIERLRGLQGVKA